MRGEGEARGETGGGAERKATPGGCSTNVGCFGEDASENFLRAIYIYIYIYIMDVMDNMDNI